MPKLHKQIRHDAGCPMHDTAIELVERLNDLALRHGRTYRESEAVSQVCMYFIRQDIQREALETRGWHNMRVSIWPSSYLSYTGRLLSSTDGNECDGGIMLTKRCHSTENLLGLMI